MCNGDCANCDAIECALKFTERIQKAQADKKQNEKEKDTMQTNLKSSGCGAPAGRDDALQNAEINHLIDALHDMGRSTPFTASIKGIVYLAAGIAVAAIIIATVAVSVCFHLASNIEEADRNASNAVETAKKAHLSAISAEARAEKNYVYLRDMKRDLKH